MFVNTPKISDRTPARARVRLKRTARSRRWPRLLPTVLLPTVLAATAVLLLGLMSGARDLPSAAYTNGLIAGPVMLAAAVLLYFHWRMSSGWAAGWLTLGLTVLATQSIAMAVLLLVDGVDVLRRPGWLIFVDLLLTCAALVAATVAERVELGVDPVLAGVMIGMLVVAGRSIFAVASPVPPLSREFQARLGLFLLGAIVVFAVRVSRFSGLPPWVRANLFPAVVLLGAGRALSYVATGDPSAAGLAVVSNVTGALLLCGTCFVLLRQSVRAEAQELDVLHRQVEEIEARGRLNQARLHEIDSTIAGIACASRLIQQGDVVPERRDSLQDMMEAEVGRLERLVQGQTADAERTIELDDTIGRLVVAQGARGHAVHHEPGGQRATGRPDDVAEAVHILLDNAAKHGGDHGTEVHVRTVDDTVEIVVTDRGPGVSPLVRSRIFDWAARGPGSSGQGIGLNVAHRLMREQGGYLELATTCGQGATFVIGLPAAREGR